MITHSVIFIFPLRLSTNLETNIEATVFPTIAKIPMYPIILSLSSGAPRGSGSKVTFIIENQDATENMYNWGYFDQDLSNEVLKKSFWSKSYKNIRGQSWKSKIICLFSRVWVSTGWAIKNGYLGMDYSISSGLITRSQILKTPFFARYFEFLP